MRILHLTSNDAHSGGARAVERLHRFLLEAGEDSLVIHQGATSGYDGELELGPDFVGRGADKLWRQASAGVGGSSLWNPSWGARGRKLEALRPDIVHVHWTYGPYGIPLRWIAGVSRRTPVVWTMHDMWPMTGGCTNPQGCERWRTGCGECPQLAAGARIERTMHFSLDATAWLWRWKRRVLASGGRLSVVTPSAWMRERVLASGIADPEDVALVPNVVDTSLFAPGDRAAARSALGLARGALVVSFIGKPDDATAYRGRHPVMIEALMALQSGLPHELAARLVVLIVGAGGQSVAVGLGGVRCVCVGRVESEVGMARCFAASDVYLSTSQYDNLPAVVQESLACGVPVVASAVGGIPEMVIDGATGRLAAPQDPAGFARQLIGLLTDEGLRAKLAGSARALAEQRFSPSAVMPAMLSVYRSAGAVFAGQSRGGIR